jgi:hypothetical protein
MNTGNQPLSISAVSQVFALSAPDVDDAGDQQEAFLPPWEELPAWI